MANLIKIKRSDVPGKIPQISDLALGELAVNTFDGKLYLKRDDGTEGIVEVGASAGNPVANNLYVAKNGNDDNDGTAISRPKLTIRAAVLAATAGTTIFVKSGDYTEINPMVLPARVSIVGDNLRAVSVRPLTTNQDLFHVNNGCYLTGMTFRDHVSPAAAVAFPAAGAGAITTSPYVQNCSSITTTGTGMRVDGDLASGLRSMVVDAYTQYNQGGIGIHMLNRGYTQLVSVFTICCDTAFLCENGGFCSITNSNTSFGTRGLVADGVSDVLYTGSSFGEGQTGTELAVNGLAARPNYGDAVKFDGDPTYYTIVNATEFFTYDESICQRDAGYIIEGVSYDVLLGTNWNAITSGNAYQRAASALVLNEQKLATTGAIGFIRDQAATIMASSPTAVAAASNGFDTVINVINGANPPALTFTNPTGVDPNLVAAKDQLLINRVFIQTEVIAWIDQQIATNTPPFVGFSYNSEICYRDVGYILDGLCYDILYGGNVASVIGAEAYFSFAVSQIPGETAQTVAAYARLDSVVRDVVQGILVSKTPGNNETQSQNAPFATVAEANDLSDLLAIITDAITAGDLDSLPARVYPDTSWADLAVQTAVASLTAAEATIIEDMIDYINDNYLDLSVITVEETAETPIPNGAAVTFHQRSLISASSHTFEYVGTGNDISTALPELGGIPIQANEVVESNGGRVYYTSTDQAGDFRIGGELTINRDTGTITGVTFDRSLFAVMTPYILALEG
jgi:hypothetical protein